MLSNFDFYCFVGHVEELRILHVLTVRGCEDVETVLYISLKKKRLVMCPVCSERGA